MKYQRSAIYWYHRNNEANQQQEEFIIKQNIAASMENIDQRNDAQNKVDMLNTACLQHKLTLFISIKHLNFKDNGSFNGKHFIFWHQNKVMRALNWK